MYLASHYDKSFLMTLYIYFGHIKFSSAVCCCLWITDLPRVVGSWCWTLTSVQVKRPLRPRRQQRPLSQEASRTTAPPGLSTTGSRPRTTAPPTLRRWAPHHKPLRYTPNKNLPSTSTSYSIVVCLNPVPSSGFYRVPVTAAHLTKHSFLPTQAFFFSFLFWEAESTVSAVNMQRIFYVFLLHRASNVKWT